MTSPVLEFIQAVPQVIQCIGCFNRIQEYCSVAPSLPLETTIVSDTNFGDSKIALQDLDLPIEKGGSVLAGNLVSFQKCSFAWKKTDDPVLKDITISIEMNLVTAVVGPVGSGKSMLLLSILGETLHLGGKTTRNKTAIAYCSQTPWLMNSSVRSNIIGILEFEEEWYRMVVWSCGLDDDFAQISEGDRTNVGSNGVSLSGGQKQRIVSVFLYQEPFR